MVKSKPSSVTARLLTSAALTWFPFTFPSVSDLIYLFFYFLHLQASCLPREVTVKWSWRQKSSCKHPGLSHFCLIKIILNTCIWPPFAITNVKNVQRKLSSWWFLGLKWPYGELFTRSGSLHEACCAEGFIFGKASTTPMSCLFLKSPAQDEVGRSHPETLRTDDGVTLWNPELPSKEALCLS